MPRGLSARLRGVWKVTKLFAFPWGDSTCYEQIFQLIVSRELVFV
jgi:hypothetical protein